ncbi:MAG: hypothetical protein Q9205_002358 [Flavoplaca limonia]
MSGPGVMAGFAQDDFDPSRLPDYHRDFIDVKDLDEFAKALNAPEASPLVALNDWRPVHQRVRRTRPRSRKTKPRRSKDETREGFVYNVLKWPFLLVVLGWILALCLSYLLIRLYIWAYERLVTWRGRRQLLRKNLQSKSDFALWRRAAEELDAHLGNDRWKSSDEYAYYDHSTVERVKEQLKSIRLQAQNKGVSSTVDATYRLRALVEACVKNNAFGVENPRLYSETYYGTKHLAQAFLDELHASLHFLLRDSKLSRADKYSLSKHLHRNYGRAALCLSGGATFSYYHFGVVKALTDHSLLPDVITGTSGGALVAALVSTRTDQELKALLVPALAHRIKACGDGFMTWGPRWWRTGARFDSLEWARHCSWSAIETSIKLDLAKYLKILKHLELLPRPLGQDWSGIWLQQFSGTITLWPKSRINDFYYLLSDPSPERLAYMISAGQRSTFPKLLFIENRMKIERLIEEGLLLGKDRVSPSDMRRGNDSPHMHGQALRNSVDSGVRRSSTDDLPLLKMNDRRSSVLEELRRQSGVFFDDTEVDGDETDGSEDAVEDGSGE